MENNEKAKQDQYKQNKDAAVKPEEETLNTTDPQEHMEGPISSLVQKVKDGVKNNDESKEEADKKKDEGM
ncbi:MAG: hypothetical protein ABIY51_10445 [Ferruginibacter sp.]